MIPRSRLTNRIGAQHLKYGCNDLTFWGVDRTMNACIEAFEERPQQLIQNRDGNLQVRKS